MTKLSAGHIRVQPSSTITCRPNFGAYCHNLMKVRRVIRIQSQKSRPLVFLHLWLFCTSSWPVDEVTVYPRETWGVVAMNKFFAIVCSLALALSVAGCAGKGKYPVGGKGKAPPPPVVTKG